MAIYVRQASLIDDERILTGLAQKYLNGDADERRFRWLYLENPFGPARAWIAYEKDNEAVGMAAVFPRRMYCDGVAMSGCVLGDLCIATKFRSLAGSAIAARLPGVCPVRRICAGLRFSKRDDAGRLSALGRGAGGEVSTYG